MSELGQDELVLENSRLNLEVLNLKSQVLDNQFQSVVFLTWLVNCEKYKGKAGRVDLTMAKKEFYTELGLNAFEGTWRLKYTTYSKEAADPRSWPGDFGLKNGTHANICYICRHGFVGMKNRVCCWTCANKHLEKNDGNV